MAFWSRLVTIRTGIVIIRDLLSSSLEEKRLAEESEEKLDEFHN
jgi:hypothetical protein